MRGSGLMGAEVVVFMVATWFDMRSCPCRQRSRVLYLCTYGTMGFPFVFWCAIGDIGSVSSGMMWGAHWDGCLGARPVCKDMLPSESTLGSGAGAASEVDSGVSTLGGGMMRVVMLQYFIRLYWHLWRGVHWIFH